MAAVGTWSGRWMSPIYRARVAHLAWPYFRRPWCCAVPRFCSSAAVSWTSTLPPSRRKEEGGSETEEVNGSACGAAAVVSGFSEFLLKSSTAWREAPYCPDYVGPVVVAKTPDGCGRGLFATKDVSAGTLLLISNPMAITYDDPLRIYLLAELVATAEKDCHFRRQIYTLADTHDAQNLLPVPTMDLLTSRSTASANINDDEAPPADLTRIMNIMLLNSFEGEFPNQDPQNPNTRLYGLWLIPSLINHSCHRNASRLIVGGAMVIHAAADIRKGEEITITYVDILVPFQARQKAFQDMSFGFTCICKRCVLEKSLYACLADVSQEYCSLHDQATDEVYMALFSPTPLPIESSFPTCMKLNKLFEAVCERVGAIDGLSELEKKWILGGYSAGFVGKWLVNGYSTRFADMPSFVNHGVIEVVSAMQATIPGLLHTLSLIAIVQSLAENVEGNDTFAKSLFKLGIDECACVYGKQKLTHLVKLMEKSRDVVPIF